MNVAHNNNNEYRKKHKTYFRINALFINSKDPEKLGSKGVPGFITPIYRIYSIAPLLFSFFPFMYRSSFSLSFGLDVGVSVYLKSNTAVC